MPNTKLSIVIPVFNEGVNLKILIPILESIVETHHEVLILYDIENDDSIPVAKSLQKKYMNLKLVHNTLGRGVINAIKSGVKNSSGEYALTIAADDIGPLLAIEDMVVLMDQGMDLVNATRYAHGGRNIGGIFISRILSTAVNKLFYVFCGSSLSDPTFGVKMFKRQKFNELKLEAEPVGWAVAFEFAIKAQAAGWKLGEVPLISLNRMYGEGKSSFRFNWAKEYSKWFFWGMKHLLFSGKRSRVTVRIPEKIKLHK